MNPYGAIEIGLGSPHRYRNRKALNNFSRIIANHVSTQYAISFAIDDQFHQSALSVVGQGQFQRAKFGCINCNVEPKCLRRFLAQSHRREIGLANTAVATCCMSAGLTVPPNC